MAVAAADAPLPSSFLAGFQELAVSDTPAYRYVVVVVVVVVGGGVVVVVVVVVVGGGGGVVVAVVVVVVVVAKKLPYYSQVEILQGSTVGGSGWEENHCVNIQSYFRWFRNPAPVEVGSLSHYLHALMHLEGGAGFLPSIVSYKIL